MFVFGVVVIEVWKTDLSVWGFVLALLICAFCLVLRHHVLSSQIHPLFFSIRVYSPFQYGRSHYEPGSWAKRHYGADYWIRPSWLPDCDDVVQDMGLYYHAAGDCVHHQLEACPLHEDPTSPDVLLSGRCHHRCWHRAAWCASVDVLQYRGSLRCRSKRWLHLPRYHCVRKRINYCK